LQPAWPRGSERSIGRVRLTPVMLALLAMLVCAAPAAAAPVLVLGPDGRVTREQDRFLAPPPPLPVGAGATKSAAPRARAAATSALRDRMAGLLRDGAIDPVEYDTRIADYDAAVRTRSSLSGTRRREMDGVINQLNAFAARDELTVSRLEVLFLQLRRNTEWWRDGNLLGSRERVRFRGSRVIFEYYPGQGLQFHPLANWGRASALFTYGLDVNGQQMLSELIPLGARRGSSLAWEYYFHFGGGRPPWTSGLSQGTALIALAKASQRLGDPEYLRTARHALKLYDLAPPLGVKVRRAHGNHYVEYTFASRLRIINGFIQAITGLYDFAKLTGDRHAWDLFRAGDREARFELPFYDTGRWSRYSNSPGSLSSTSYHILLRDFLRGICQRTGTRIYCQKASRFTAYLRRGHP